LPNKIPDSVRDQLDSMLHLGAAGDLSDGQLLDRVNDSKGDWAEAAFAVLVERHGPMVLRVCRDATGNPHDAEDACQAVFLVLARKAGSVRRRESAAAWLYGVARKVSSRARRDEARRRERERRKAELAARQVLDATEPESWEELYEEIDRLPERYRSAIVLCHLEGLAHEEAASRLRCPLGTLQSRLLRARARLRDRLARRGVTPGAGAMSLFGPSIPSSPLPTKFTWATVRLALSDSAGVVSAPVASLAEGVLVMSTISKLNVAPAALMAIGVVAGVAWAVGLGQGGRPEAPRPPVVVVPVVSKVNGPGPVGKESPGPLLARGVVVDEAGRPVSGAEVVAFASTRRETRRVSAVDGSFEVPIATRQQLDGIALLARSPGGERLGTFRYGYQLTRSQAEAPSRIVLKPARSVAVRVADAKKAPVADAAVEVIGGLQILSAGRTGADGVASLPIPPDARVEWVIGLKSGRGLDYAEFGTIDEAGRPQGGVPATDIPTDVPLVLEKARTATIRAVDGDGKPLVDVTFYPWLIHKEGRRSQLNIGDFPPFLVKTDAEGIATFDWLPTTKGGITFWPLSEGFARRRVVLEEGTTGPVTAKLSKNETIRGHVFRPDGSPAPGVRVDAFGTGEGLDNGRGHARTAVDGSYEMAVPAGEGYAVSVQDDDWTAPSRLDVILQPGQPVDGVDFTLIRGTIIRGKVTVGPGDRPAPNTYILLNETGGRGPDGIGRDGQKNPTQIRRQFSAATDAEGRYSIRVAPGSYTVSGPPRTGTETVVVKDEAELVRDYRMPRPEKGPISGRIVEGLSSKGVAGAKVEIVAASFQGFPFVVTADADGRFRAERALDKLTICAKNPDGSLGAMVEVGAETEEVVIPIVPTATASGLLLDEQGRPAANQLLTWGRRVLLGEDRHSPFMTCFGTKVVTDTSGKFTLPALVVGQEYSISVQRDNAFPAAGVVRPETPAPIDLGTLRVGAYRPPLTAEEMSSFKGGPGPGDPAPPIEGTTLDGKPLRLEDYRGKFVLLDFWATWCGPCIGEIPQLQAVHDAFGKDGRFAILSLSVDEKIDEPRQFQEKRKLPWSQGFIGEGIHSAIPGSFGVRAIPAFVLVGPEGKIVAKGMRGEDIKKEVARAIGKVP
jgi:RNA polymerase sigma factor (sigma-70 family)